MVLNNLCVFYVEYPVELVLSRLAPVRFVGKLKPLRSIAIYFLLINSKNSMWIAKLPYFFFRSSFNLECSCCDMYLVLDNW